MSVPAAYLAVIVIWSTTPLAIKWSGEGIGFSAGVTSRMLIGTVICLLLIKALRIDMPWHKQARQAYLSGSIAVFGAMSCVYFAAQYISSGLIAVLFGLTPVVTTLIAVIMGQERVPTRIKVFGIITALLGSMVIFNAGGEVVVSTDRYALLYGGIGMLGSVLLHSLSTVLVKRSAQGLPALAVATGSLVFSLPLYVLLWLLVDGQLPVQIPVRTGMAILYAGVIGSVVGYVLYFYALKHVSVSQMALVTLITPVTALLIGHLLNNEQISTSIWLGTGMILTGLSLHQWGARLTRRFV